MTPSKPLVSVVITSYNYAVYVGECVRSVLTQDYGPLELVVVDDASSDNSREIIERELQGARIPVKTLFKKTTEGQASAMNAGFALTSGEFVAFLDSDDHWYPNRISAVMQHAALVPSAAIYQHQLDTGKGEKRGALLSADVFALLKAWSGGRFNIADDTTGALHAPYAPTSGLVFPRSVLEKIMPIPAAIRICPDAYLTRTAIAYGPLVSIPLTLGVWRDHAGNAGKSGANLHTYWLPTILPELNRFYREKNLGLELRYDECDRSPVPASLMLGEWRRFAGGTEPVRDALIRNLTARGRTAWRLGQQARRVNAWLRRR